MRFVVGAFIYRLHLSIDRALSLSYRRDQNGDGVSFVARITLVKGIPFYGFHVGYQFFLKIYLYNPVVVSRLADLLHQGAILNQKFQPYEAHLQYLLQFMADYNLYGCDYLDSAQTHFRSPVPLHEYGSNSSHLWHSASIQPQFITDDLTLPRLSHCSLEVDICVQDILNRRKIQGRNLHHDFIELVNPIPDGIKLVSSMAGLWKDEMSRTQKDEANQAQPGDQIMMSADLRESQQQEWIHQEEYWQQIQELIAKEGLGLNLDVNSFVNSDPDGHTINTALQSVEDLYPSNLLPILGLAEPSSSVKVVNEGTGPLTSDDEDFSSTESDEKDLVSPRRPVTERPSAANLDCTVHIISDSTREPRHVGNSISGLCLSAFSVGQVPTMAIQNRLLDIASDLLLKGSRMSPHDVMGTSQLKRKEWNTNSPVPKKRAKQGTELSIDSEWTSQKASVSKEANDSPSDSASVFSTAHDWSQGKHDQNHLVDHRYLKPTLNFAVGEDKKRIGSIQGLTCDVQIDTLLKSDDHPRPLSHSQPSFSMISADVDEGSQLELPSSFPSTNLSETSSQDFKVDRSSTLVVFAELPPPFEDGASMLEYGLPSVVYKNVFYSKERDVPTRKREYAGREFRLYGNTLPYLPVFNPHGNSSGNWHIGHETVPNRARTRQQYRQQKQECSWRSWEPLEPPPSYDELKQWVELKGKHVLAKDPTKPFHHKIQSQIEGPTPRQGSGYSSSQRHMNTSVQHEVQYMSTMSLEVHVNTRGKLVPNPEEDEIQCIFWCCKGDEVADSSQETSKDAKSGILALCQDDILAQRLRKFSSSDVAEENSELSLLVRMVEIVRTHDPDILTGYEVHGGSWGYLIERARLKYDYDLCDEFSRMKAHSHGKFDKQGDRWGFTTTSTIKVTGRHMINIWRAMRGELNLLQYTMESVVWHLLHKRIPHYSWRSLTEWYQSGKVRDLSRVLNYYKARARLDIDILESNELIPRTSEQARLLGVDFFSVFSRGSQFKVESIMFRIAKPESFMLVSPSRKQVGGQNALECLPLVMEPRSAFYSNPLVVLDFQSLYPSVMIAYNYCYSTFLGRITNWRGKSKMGFTEYKRQEGVLSLLKDYINISPNGMMFAKPQVRKSLLAKMLTEILETRIMVKNRMKHDKDDKILQRLLNNRQLALKLLANVTYGYTSASFSGRMPCSEIADSIVQTARETLERAIAYIHSNERWGAEVVYGDTDSIFVYLKGRSKDQAFDIGHEMAKAITERNPQPVKLKFEKVYLPCVLLAKKRYVGYKYESKGQLKPDFDAKGIETVRRDGTPAEQKIEEKALRILFETADLSQVKQYFTRQCKKIMGGRVSTQDFCFAREVRLGTYSDKGPTPAGALISTKRMLEDARAEPQYGERVPYVVITGAPGARLIDRSVAPDDLLRNPHWQLDAEYYILKNLIPPLERIFSLVGASVREWYDSMPKVRRVNRYSGLLGKKKKMTIDAYMKSTRCLVCNRRFASSGNRSMCGRCDENGPASLIVLQTKVRTEQQKYQDLLTLCRSCEGVAPLEEVKCDSKDCPAFWTRTKQQTRMVGEGALAEPIIQELVQREKRNLLEW